MTPGGMGPRDRGQPQRRLLHVARGAAAHDRPRLRPDRQHQLGDRRDRQHRPGELRRCEVGALRADDDDGAREARARASPSTASRRASSRRRWSPRSRRRSSRRIVEQIPAGRLGSPRRSRAWSPSSSTADSSYITGTVVLDQRRAVHVNRHGSDTPAAGDAVGPEAGLSLRSTRSRSARQLRQLVAGLARNPAGVWQALGSYASGLAAATSAGVARALGADAPGPIEPARKDQRFSDPAWQENPAYFWCSSRATCCRRGCCAGARRGGAGSTRRTRRKARFAIDDRSSTRWRRPTSCPATRPRCKRAFETGGASARRGARNFLDDLATNKGCRGRSTAARSDRRGPRGDPGQGRVPQRPDRADPVRAADGDGLRGAAALQPAVDQQVLRDGPRAAARASSSGRCSTATRCSRSATQPGRVACATSRSTTTSSTGRWRALDVVEAITGAGEVNIVGALPRRHARGDAARATSAAGGDDRVRSRDAAEHADRLQPSPACSARSPTPTALAARRAQDAREGLPRARPRWRRRSTLLRANDLIWNYVVSNWLMGEPRRRSTSSPGTPTQPACRPEMHAFYLRSCYVENQLRARRARARGRADRLGEVIRTDTYILAASEDHIAPWTSSLRVDAAALAATSGSCSARPGHIAGIVNPPSPKSRYWTNDELPPDPDAWLAGARAARGVVVGGVDRAGSAVRSGGQREPPPLGSERYRPLAEAPGAYILS